MRLAAGLVSIFVTVFLNRIGSIDGLHERSDFRYQKLKSSLLQLTNEQNPTTTTIEQARLIKLNLKRWEDLPKNLGDLYILINVPSARLEYWNSDNLVAGMSGDFDIFRIQAQ